ncbi:unnamed protein product, partial [Prorocentrum cordatum]
ATPPRAGSHRSASDAAQRQALPRHLRDAGRGTRRSASSRRALAARQFFEKRRQEPSGTAARAQKPCARAVSTPWAKSTFVPSDEYPWPLHIISSNGAALPHFACCFKFGSFHLVREVRAIPLTSETWEL